MINKQDKILQKYIDEKQISEKYQIIFKRIKAVYERFHEEDIMFYKLHPIRVIDDNSPFSIKHNLMPKFSEVLLKFIDKKIWQMLNVIKRQELIEDYFPKFVVIKITIHQKKR